MEHKKYIYTANIYRTVSVISSVIPLALKGFYLRIIRIGKITLSAKGITDEFTDNHPIDICSVHFGKDKAVFHKQKHFVGTLYL